MVVTESGNGKYLSSLTSLQGGRVFGKVRQVIGLVIEVSGVRPFIGEICRIRSTTGAVFIAEVVGFREKCSLLMPLGNLQGIAPGCVVEPTGKSFSVRVSDRLKGKVLDGLGNLLENGLPPLSPDEGEECPVNNTPPNPLERRLIESILPTGVKAIDGLMTCGEGQRLGIFSGSGVGKSTMLGMVARHSASDVNVIALIGERGREVGDFLHRDLGEEGLKRSIVVVSTSDRPALERVMGAMVAITIAEYFRDLGAKVIFMMDSVTRLCMAQREIGLAVGEPPSTKGYTPSVFALIARYLERSGQSKKGSITGFYTVLVDGDDFNEPITDAVRSVLDGHIVLSRKLAAQNHFPAADILNCNSRLMINLIDDRHRTLAAEARKLLSTYESMEDLINIGAYVPGSQPDIDRSIQRRPELLKFLRQEPEESFSLAATLAALEKTLGTV
jgi:flagellum-specific ATP synthase